MLFLNSQLHTIHGALASQHPDKRIIQLKHLTYFLYKWLGTTTKSPHENYNQITSCEKFCTPENAKRSLTAKNINRLSKQSGQTAYCVSVTMCAFVFVLIFLNNFFCKISWQDMQILMILKIWTFS